MQTLCGLLWKELTRRRKSFGAIFFHAVLPVLLLILFIVTQLTETRPRARPTGSKNITSPFNQTRKTPENEQEPPKRIVLMHNEGEAISLEWKPQFDPYWRNCSLVTMKYYEQFKFEYEESEESLVENVEKETLLEMTKYIKGPYHPYKTLFALSLRNETNDPKHHQLSLTYYFVPFFYPMEGLGGSIRQEIIRYHLVLLSYYYNWYEEHFSELLEDDSPRSALAVRYKTPPPSEFLPRNGLAVLAIATINLSLIVLCSHLLSEKASKLKDLMHLCGVGRFKYYLHFFIIDFVMLIVPSVLLVLILFKPEIEQFASFFLVTMIYNVALILFTVGFTMFFERPLLGNAFYALLAVFSAFQRGAVYHKESHIVLPEAVSLSLCLFPSYGYTAIQDAIVERSIEPEYQAITRWFQKTETQVLLTPGNILIVLILSWFLWLFVIFYIGPIWPFQSGTRQPWWFPLEKLFAKMKSKLVEKKVETSSLFEPDPSNLAVGLEVNNLQKKYGLYKMVLKNVFLKVYHGQITVLLGHNGAGKTTLISLITGMESTTGGSILIDGVNVDYQPSKARRNIGCCPQTNTLYDTLTVRQHLYLFGLIKKFPFGQLSKEIQRVLQLVRLTDKAGTNSRNLSGGQKRRLQLALAFIGGSKILILDEPSSGLDVEARRVIWDMLLEIKKDYLIFMTTHHMEEADCLGDRVAIMHDGNVKCCGSSLFLKRVFSIGNMLRVSKGQTFNAELCGKFIQAHLETSKFIKESRTEAMYKFAKEDVPKLPGFFDDLEEKKKELGINSIGVSITTLDDVFIKVGEMFEEKNAHNSENVLNISVLKKPLRPNFFQILTALMIKRCNMAKRSVLIPCLMLVALALTIAIAVIFRQLAKSSEPKEFLSELQPPNLNYSCLSNGTMCSFFPEFKPASKTDVRLLNITENEYNCFEVQSVKMDQFDALTTTVNGMLKMLLPDMTVEVVASVKYPEYYFGVPSSVGGVPATFIALCILCVLVVSYRSTFVEKRTNVKFLQLMSGVSPFTYWFSNLCFDMLLGTVMLLPLLFLLPPLVYILGGPFIFNTFTTIVGYYFFLLLFLLATIIQAYFTTILPIGVSAGMQMHIFLGLLSPMADLIIKGLNTNIAPYSGDRKVIELVGFWLLYLLRLIFACSPVTGIRHAYITLMDYSFQEVLCKNTEKLLPNYCTENINKEFSQMCCKRGFFRSFKNLFSGTSFDEVHGYYVLISLVASFFSFVVLLSVEYLTILRVLQCPRATTRVQDEDTDVANERSQTEYLIVSKQLSTNALTVKDLTKRFGKTYAVNRLTFTMEARQCFGFLGVNGAGKSTAFKMLVGEITRTAGESHIGGTTFARNFHNYRRQIGYCPQFDCFVEGLTAREMLYLFAKIRGIHPSELKQAVNDIIELVDLKEYASRVADFYSGGNKRKLSVGMAIIGFPKIIFLDEPTAAIDPVARRKIWKVIEHAQKSCGSSIMLTSHALDECEALCEKIVVMVAGKFKCLGSTQHLKSKYGQGVTITAKLKPNVGTIQVVQKAIISEIPQAVVEDSHTNITTLQVKDPAVKIGRMYAVMEKIKGQYDLEDYQIADTNLEQIFLHFAKAAYNTKP